eukprot:894327_1
MDAKESSTESIHFSGITLASAVFVRFKTVLYGGQWRPNCESTFITKSKDSVHNDAHSNLKPPAYKYWNTTASKMGRGRMQLWFDFHCNVIEYFHRISQLERLIIFDIERDSFSVFKEAFYNVSGYWLQGMLPEKNHHSDHATNPEEQSGSETLNCFCGLYVEKETDTELHSFKKELYLKTHIGANHRPQDHAKHSHRYTPHKTRTNTKKWNWKKQKTFRSSVRIHH